MKRGITFFPILSVVSVLCGPLHATLVVNPSQPITERVLVQVTQVARNDGSTPAPLFGTALQQSTIFAQIDVIWAQAGIDIQFDLSSDVWEDTFTLSGTPGGNNPRPTSDLNTILSRATTAGVLAASPNTINLFLVQIVPGFSQTSNNASNGLAFVGANGITLWAGPNLTSFTNGQDVIASVLAHEIGHNLGLDHIVEAQNLMQAGGGGDDGERLNAAQISTALSSSFSVPVPEPATLALLLMGGLALWTASRPRRSN